MEDSIEDSIGFGIPNRGLGERCAVSVPASRHPYASIFNDERYAKTPLSVQWEPCCLERTSTDTRREVYMRFQHRPPKHRPDDGRLHCIQHFLDESIIRLHRSTHSASATPSELCLLYGVVAEPHARCYLVLVLARSLLLLTSISNGRGGVSQWTASIRYFILPYLSVNSGWN